VRRLVAAVAILAAAPAAAPAAPVPSERDGALVLDGKPRYLFSGDYPYYRDDAANWERRLLQMKAAGMRYVSFYIPWRHHQPRESEAPDFTGRTAPERNVVGFMELIRRHGLLAIAKPGPFIHAELQYGGLPDFVNPAVNPRIEAAQTGAFAPFPWVLDPETNGIPSTLPAPGDPVWEDYVRAWMLAVAAEIAPFAAPAGPIVALQVANEGIYSDSGANWINSYDYSRANAAAYRRWLESRYGGIGAYNGAHDSAHASYAQVEPPRTHNAAPSPQAALAFLDWSEYQAEWLGRTIERWTGYLVDGTSLRGLPVFANLNFNGFTFTTTDQHGTNDGLLSRADPTALRPTAWGYTNWLGVLPREQRVYEQYVLAGTIARGANLEEDWGFSAIYDPAYEFTQPSLFQSMLFTANGATGINVYTAVGTTHWQADPQLDDGRSPATKVAERAGKPYPASAPIGPDGAVLPKYYTVQQLGRLYSAIGSGLAGGRLAGGIGWATYRPYAHAGAWTHTPSGDAASWRESGLSEAPTVTLGGMDGAIRSALDADVQFGQADLSTAPVAELLRHPVIAIRTFDYMGLAEQEKLREYARRGGMLLVTGAVPSRDGRLAPAAGALADLFPHVSETVEAGEEPTRIAVEARGITREALARGHRRLRDLPGDALVVARAGEETVGYIREIGRGRAVYLGFSPWADDDPEPNGDPVLAAANSGLAEFLGFRLGKLRRQAWTDARADADAFVTLDGRVRGRRHVVVLTRATEPRRYDLRVRLAGGRVKRFPLDLPAGGVAHLVLERTGRVAALYVRGLDDLSRAGDVRPRVRGWSLSGPGDLMVVAGRRRSVVAVGGDGGSRVRVPFRARRVVAVSQPFDLAGQPAGGRPARVAVRRARRSTSFDAAPQHEVSHYLVSR